MLIAFLGQKGGVGKTTGAQTMAVEYAKAGWTVLIADVDPKQESSDDWGLTRHQNGIKPAVATAVYNTYGLAIAEQKNYDLVIIDGSPDTNQGLLEAAIAADLVILPTGTSLRDMKPTLKLAIELDRRIESCNMFFLVFKPTSDYQYQVAKATIVDAGFKVLDNYLPIKENYISASDAGFGLTETSIKTLNKLALALADEIDTKLPQ